MMSVPPLAATPTASLLLIGHGARNLHRSSWNQKVMMCESGHAGARGANGHLICPSREGCSQKNKAHH
uniref:Putative secreted protein n=1 Tax=Anopheles darlingi TaxID=43151 RepID=A0A2M4D6X5_ANODA